MMCATYSIDDGGPEFAELADALDTARGIAKRCADENMFNHLPVMIRHGVAEQPQRDAVKVWHDHMVVSTPVRTVRFNPNHRSTFGVKSDELDVIETWGKKQDDFMVTILDFVKGKARGVPF